FYALAGIPPGTYTLVISMIGYEEERVRLTVTEGQKLRRDFSLETRAVGVEGVEITAVRARFEHEVDVGVEHINIQQQRKLPSLGEEDVFRPLEMLPGVISVSDLTSAFYVRGGSMDQNLVVLDDIPVYYPYHMMGTFSTFITESLRDADLYTGSIPARYGGAVSSVLDIRMRNGSCERITASGELGLITSKLTVEGPLPGKKGSWIVSGRRTYIDALSWLVEEILAPESLSFYSVIEDYVYFTVNNKPFYFPYHFYDIQSNVNIDINDNSRISATGFAGNDEFHHQDSLLEVASTWGNAGVGLKWRCVFSPRLLSVVGVDISRYRGYDEWNEVEFELNEGDTIGYEWDGGESVRGIGVRWGYSWLPGTRHRVNFGADVDYIRCEDDGTGKHGGVTTYFNDDQDSSWLFGLYLDDKWEPAPFWVVEAGLRGEYYNKGYYFRMSPRLGLKRRLTADWALKAGAGMYYQYLYKNYPYNEEEVKLPVSYYGNWVMADSANPPLRSIIGTLGSEYLLSDKGKISLELYCKDLRNIRETCSGQPGQGFSYGTEVLFKYGTSWLGYSYSVVRYRFEDEWFYPLHDSRHNLHVVLNLPFPKGWGLTSTWTLNSGFPYSGVIGFYQYVDHWGREVWYPVYGQKGEFRYPPYHRLDIGVSKRFPLFKKYEGSLYFQVLNVYARANVLLYDDYFDQTSGISSRREITSINFPLPVMGLKVRF
ncbi:TonB-dependent receptor plug domain-containing protein, partial [candidate division WOR-3 bacterium]|nr:TonB-dependent receptor plug domain-containing protein [candidate division WOR-3 bacterium]